MEGFGYQYPPQFPAMLPLDGQFLDHGDGFGGDYYPMEPGPTGDPNKRRNQQRSQRNRSRSRSHSRSRSRSRSKSRTRSRSRSCSSGPSGSRARRDLNMREPSFWDAFRVLYYTPSQHKKSTTKYLATKKRQDRVQEFLKSDGFGSKRWLFYPRFQNKNETGKAEAGSSTSRDTCDQRVKVDGDFFSKYKRSKKLDSDAPIRKLKRWELLFYKKLGFLQAV